MRFLFLLLTALCLSAVSFGASASTRVGLPVETGVRIVAAMTAALSAPVEAQAQVVPPDYSVIPAVDDLGQIIAPGDDGLLAEDAADEAPPGYCNIWSADLLDPLDLLDEIEESSALFDLPIARLVLPTKEVVHISPGRLALPATAVFKPPISLS